MRWLGPGRQSQCNVAPALAAAFAVLFSQPGHAFGGPPYLVPDNPSPSDAISVDILGDGCDILDTGVVPIQITQQRNAIIGTFFGGHEGDPENCIYGTGTQTYPVGSRPARSYTFSMTWNFFGVAGEVETQTLGILPLTVKAVPPPAAPTAAPTLGIAGFGILLLALVGFADRALRKKAQRG